MKAAITIICSLFTVTLFGQVNDANAFFDGTYDKLFIRSRNIKQVSVETYINEGKSSRFDFEFDSSGLLTKQIVVDSSGKRLNEYLFSYNKHGDQIQRKNINYDLNKTSVVSFYKVYDGLMLVQETASDLPFTIRHMYDESGRRFQSITFLASDTTTSAKRVSLYTYDAGGKLMGIQESYSENKGSAPFSLGKTTYIYDEAGNITNVIREGKANYTFSYNTNRLLKSKTVNMPEEFSKLTIVDKYSYTFWK